MLLVLLVFFTVCASPVWAFDPPEIIAELRGEPPDSQNFGNHFCWIGDQNGDGFDDLLVNHDYSRIEGAVNAVKLFFGGQEMDSSPDLIFRPSGENSGSFGEQFVYLGDLIGDGTGWIAISTSILEEQGNRARETNMNFYRLGAEPDSLPLFVTHRIPGNGYTIKTYPASRPSDFNGDGYNDFLCVHYENGLTRMKIMFGGAEFDTIPDWSSNQFEPNSPSFRTGGDVNGDGYDDFILNGKTLYLGGDPMDTTALWTYESPDTTDRRLHSFVLFPDVNNDGYDDWGCYWTENTEQYNHDGWYLFYGSAHPDFIPDVDLEGSHSIWDTSGELCGGDINGDGLGDVITINRGGYGNDGELHIHFGSRRGINRTPSISVNCVEQYGEEKSYGFKIGSIGDYNNNGKNDFFISEYFWGSHTELLCLGGDWEGGVPGISGKYLPQVNSWEITTSPNPFNSTLIVSISGSLSGEFELNLVDIHGCVVKSKALSGSGNEMLTQISADDLPAGIYFIQCVNTIFNSSQSKIKKVVLLR